MNKNIDERRKDFYNQLVEFIPIYGKDMLRQYFDYWSEPNRSNKSMRFELEKTWSLNLRLKRWQRTNQQYGNNSTNTKEGTSTARIKTAKEW